MGALSEAARPLLALLALLVAPARSIGVKPVSLGTYGGVPCVFLAEGPLLGERARVFPAPVAESSVRLLEGLFGGGLAGSAGETARLVNRDGALYDNLPWAWGRSERPKAEAFAELAMRPRGLPDTPSAYHVFLTAIREVCCAEVYRGYIEPASVLTDAQGALVIGATLSLRESPELVELYGEAVPMPRDTPLRTAEVEVLTDEMVGIALAAGVPIEVDDPIWRAAAVEASFVLDGDVMRISVEPPAASGAQSDAAAAAAAAAAAVPKAWEIKSAAELRAMPVVKLAAVLLASGVSSLPRPREATPERLRALALPLLDEALQNQLQLSDAIDREDYEEAQRLVGSKSRRQLLMEELGEAIAAEEYERADALQEKLAVLTDARMDVTAPEGSYDRYLDADDWYVEQQRRIYGPKNTECARTRAQPRALVGPPLWSRARLHPLRARARRGPRGHARAAASDGSGGGGSWFDALSDALLGEQVDLGGLGDGADGAGEAAAAQLADAAAELDAADGFDGYALRELIYNKWGEYYDVDFEATEYLGRYSLYLNVFPWTPERKPFRHADEQAYLEHLQAVSELLIKWRRVASVKAQVAETTKKPRRGTIPLKTVPLRLELPDELVRSFLA